MSDKLATVSKKSIVSRTTTINIRSPKAVADFANELKKFIVTQKLYSDVKGKNFVNVEGWQFAGASMGIYPMLEKLEDVSTDKETKYRAEVKLVQIETEKVVGYGVAICSNKEGSKKSFDEYAIASMAQTRATSKAFRNTLGWLMKLAGYESTPAEEASGTTAEPSEPEVVETPIATMREQVTDKLSGFKPHERMRVLKTVGKLNENNLTDSQYRQLWYELKLNEVRA
jgi:hypothetical protein